MDNIGINYIEKNREKIEKLAINIWNNPEGPFEEYMASEWCATILEENNFNVKRGIGDVKTAIKAKWGKGKPVMGFLAEYDALPFLSQKIINKKEALVENGYGHGCGHNLMAAANIATVLALKEEMIAKKLEGTIVFFGCPAEETLTGKGRMAKYGAFDDIDINIAWHPMGTNTADEMKMTGIRTVKFHFEGKSAHAASAYDGRSALDAVELMNVGANYLREHIPPDVRLHYSVSSNSIAPNVVPDRATAFYYVRSFNAKTIEDVYSRVCDIAKGAALMTSTKLTIEYIGGCYPLLQNKI